MAFTMPDDTPRPPQGPAPVLLGLGANLGDPVRQLARAVERLEEVLTDAEASSVYRSEPVGHREQPDFYNLVVCGASPLAPAELLRFAQEVERELGRTRSFPDAPRTIDVDLLACGSRVVETPELVLPHPRLHRRAFVLVPLAEVAPEWRHPLMGLTARELLLAAGDLERIERWGILPRSRGG